MSLLATLMILLRMVLKRISRLILYRVRVAMQQRHITARSAVLQEKNTEVEHAVNDLIYKILSYQFESPLERISTEDIVKLKDHYNHFIFQALLNSAKNLLNALKKRMASKGGATSILSSSKPFFEVDVQLMPPSVSLSPSLDQIQECISKSAIAVLECYRSVLDWGYAKVVPSSSASAGGRSEMQQQKHNFF